MGPVQAERLGEINRHLAAGQGPIRTVERRVELAAHGYARGRQSLDELKVRVARRHVVEPGKGAELI